MPTGSCSRLARVVHDLDAMLGDDTLAGVSSDERLEILATAGAALRRLEAMIVETVATGDAVDLSHGAGCRSTSELLQRTLSTDAAGAARIGKVVDLVRRDVNLLSGERLPARWPELREAMLDGRVSVAGMLAATTPVERCRDRLTPDERASADQCLADAARGGYGSADAGKGVDADRDSGADAPIPTTDDLGILAHALVAVLDPDGAEPDDANAQHRRGLTIGRLRDGLRPIRGWLSPEVAAQLETVLDAINNPAGEGPAKPRVAFADADADAGAGADPGGGADPFNSDPRNAIDGRTPLQKRHDAFAAALAIAARHKDMPTLGGAAPTLVVTINVADLERGSGAASLPGAHGHSHAHVPARVAAQTGCSGTIQRVVFDGGRVVGISSTGRVFTVHQRRAIVARDKECLIPGCHVPAGWCEIHHVTEHSRGGPTETDNGVPLCWWHHRSLDGSGWEIRMASGVPQVRGPAWWDPEQLWRTPRLSDRDARTTGRTAPVRHRPRPQRGGRPKPSRDIEYALAGPAARREREHELVIDRAPSIGVGVG